MKKNRTAIVLMPFIIIISAAFIMPSCVVLDDGRRITNKNRPAPAPPSPLPPASPPPPPEAPAEKKMSTDEQEAHAEEIFASILEMTADVDRVDALPDMERAYREIIDSYPDSGLAQESFMRLINIQINDYEPPRLMEADALYREFIEKYPDSPIRTSIDDNIMRMYHRNRLWNRLLIASSQYVKDFIDTEDLRYPLFLFFFTEARYHLGDIFEAEKGYRIIKELKPGTLESKISANRLKEIEKSKAARTE